ncbi:MAG: hypothetical protein Q4D82_07360, partial [Neisseria sp.]|nr:hypothetical protein [Neisseria sp.]
MKSIQALLQHADVYWAVDGESPFLLCRDSLCPFSDGIAVGNPATGETLAFVRKTSAAELNEKIARAQEAQKAWAAQTAL